MRINMREKMQQIINSKQFHIIMIVVIVIAILFIVGIIMLKYHVEGETNLPFNLSKITVISGIEGIDNETEDKWNLTVNQNNDIYLYIENNNNYNNDEAIESINLENFKVEQNIELGQKKLYKPEQDAESTLFKNIEANETQTITYKGRLNSNIKNLEISNQGGLVVFRYATTNIGNYISNEDEQINHEELLKKLNINNEDLKFKLYFDIYINLESGKKYSANVSLDLPIENVVENGTQSKEITELNNVIFKRVNE
jgi:hypothetical protein